MIWWNKTDITPLSRLVQNMEKSISDRGLQNLRVFIMYMNPLKHSASSVEKKLNEFIRVNNVKNVAITHIPSSTDPETAGLYDINPKANNTVFLYKKRKVAAKWVNLESNDESAKAILENL